MIKDHFCWSRATKTLKYRTVLTTNWVTKNTSCLSKLIMCSITKLRPAGCPASTISDAASGMLEPPHRKSTFMPLLEGRLQPPPCTPWICACKTAGTHRGGTSCTHPVGIGFGHLCRAITPASTPITHPPPAQKCPPHIPFQNGTFLALVGFGRRKGGTVQVQWDRRRLQP